MRSIHQNWQRERTCHPTWKDCQSSFNGSLISSWTLNSLSRRQSNLYVVPCIRNQIPNSQIPLILLSADTSSFVISAPFSSPQTSLVLLANPALRPPGGHYCLFRRFS